MYRIIWSLVVFLLILATLPPGLYLFSKQRLSGTAFLRIFVDYTGHILVIVSIYAAKSLADLANDPLRDLLSLDFTPVIYAIEGDLVLHVQNTLQNDGLTVFLAGVYTIGFLFVFNFSFVLYSYDDERSIADKFVFANLVLTLISLVFFLFVPVFVTSWPAMDHSLDPAAPERSGIPGMQPLLYTLTPWLSDFFSAHETFDNCFPSLHIAIPLAMTLILFREYRSVHGTQCIGRDTATGWRGRGRGHSAYLVFLACLTVLIAMSVLYLGIHWFIDIPAGIAIVLPAVWLADRHSGRFFSRLNGRLERIRERYSGNTRARRE